MFLAMPSLVVHFMLVCVLSFSLAEAGQEEQQRLVSVSLCADAYVLALAKPEEIQALSWQVDHPLSAAPAWARTRPKAWDSPERLTHDHLAESQNTLFVLGPEISHKTEQRLKNLGFQSVRLEAGKNFEDVKREIRKLAKAFDKPERASLFIGGLEARLDKLKKRRQKRGATPGLLYLSATGGSAGSGVYVDAVFKAAGGMNVLAEKGFKGWVPARPSILVDVEPDLIVTSFFNEGYISQSSIAQHHSIYQKVLEATPGITIPGRLWTCAGPHLIEAAEQLADALEEPDTQKLPPHPPKGAGP